MVNMNTKNLGTQMALQATPYKISLDISDTDRGVYESVKFTVARHPSETELRLASRVLAYAMFYHPQLAFGRGLSDTDEAALWKLISPVKFSIGLMLAYRMLRGLLKPVDVHRRCP